MGERVVVRIGGTRARCVPAVTTWNWFYNRGPGRTRAARKVAKS
jgi:hypothetical protein